MRYVPIDHNRYELLIQRLPQVVDVRILAKRASGHQVCTLPKVMSILCEGYYDPELRRDYIYQVVLNTVDCIFNMMIDLRLPIENLRAGTFPWFVKFKRHQRLRELPYFRDVLQMELRAALVALWGDPVVKRFYQDEVESIAHPSAT